MNEKDMNEINRQLYEQGQKIEQILELLQGNKLDPERGLVHRLRSIELFIKGLENTRTYLKGSIATTIAIITIVGGLIGFVIKIIEWIKK